MSSREKRGGKTGRLETAAPRPEWRSEGAGEDGTDLLRTLLMSRVRIPGPHGMSNLTTGKTEELVGIGLQLTCQLLEREAGHKGKVRSWGGGSREQMWMARGEARGPSALRV